VLGKNSVNYDTDDVINGIADANKIVFSLVTSPSAILGGIGDSFELFSSVTLNGSAVSKDVAYTSSASSVATVSGSGIVDIVSTGSCVITSYLVDNTSITDTTNVISSSAVVENDIRFNPTFNYVLESDIQSFTVYLYQNGVRQSDLFTTTVFDYNVPSENYTLTNVDGNNFTLKNNEKFLDYPLILTFTTGSISKNLEIELRGAW